MRNIFDQYDQPENKLTHALYCTLANDRQLIRPFLAWLGIPSVPPRSELKIVEQQVPGVATQDDGDGGKGLPDLCIYTDDGWIVLFEMKVQSKLHAGQLRRHRETAKRFGFDSPHLVTVTVDPVGASSSTTKATFWREVYAWFDKKAANSFWARAFVEYMQVFEAKMLATDYDIRGTLTMFNGLRFDDEHPYTYREGKRIIRLLGDHLQARGDLQRELGMDPKGERRPAITGSSGGGSGVWDFIPLVVARGAQFTQFPHLTLAIRQENAIAAVTVPNGVSGGFRTKLKQGGEKGFFELIHAIERGLRPVVKRSVGSKPLMYATQRHFRSQRSKGEKDGWIEADLTTCAPAGKSKVKYQPEWGKAIYQLLVNKRSNIQFGIEMRLSYDCPRVRSEEAADLFADSWKAMRPLLEFVLAE
jgi:hypothetical protein